MVQVSSSPPHLYVPCNGILRIVPFLILSEVVEISAVMVELLEYKRVLWYLERSRITIWLKWGLRNLLIRVFEPKRHIHTEILADMTSERGHILDYGTPV